MDERVGGGEDFRVGPYRCTAVLGEGSFARVYRTVDPSTGAPLALKVYRPEVVLDSQLVRRIHREFSVAAGLRHPNLVRVHDCVASVDGAYLVMDLVEGSSLDRILSTGPLPVGRAVAVAVDVGRAMAYLHGRSLLHRDVKPANVVVTNDGPAVLMDFNLITADDMTRITDTGFLVGTPVYMAPELFDGAHATVASDVYALGLVLTEALTGTVPTSHAEAGAPPFGTTPSRVTGSTTVPSALEAVCRRATAPDPDRRYPSVDAMLADLEGPPSKEAVVDEPSPPDGGTTLRPSDDRFRAGTRSTAAAAITVVLLIVLFAAVVVRRPTTAPTTVPAATARATPSAHHPGVDEISSVLDRFERDVERLRRRAGPTLFRPTEVSTGPATLDRLDAAPSSELIARIRAFEPIVNGDGRWSWERRRRLFLDLLTLWTVDMQCHALGRPARFGWRPTAASLVTVGHVPDRTVALPDDLVPRPRVVVFDGLQQRIRSSDLFAVSSQRLPRLMEVLQMDRDRLPVPLHFDEAWRRAAGERTTLLIRTTHRTPLSFLSMAVGDGVRVPLWREDSADNHLWVVDLPTALVPAEPFVLEFSYHSLQANLLHAVGYVKELRIVGSPAAAILGTDR